jgi:hypothetical protein
VTNNENESIIVVAGAEKLTFYNEVRKIFTKSNFQNSFSSRKMNDYYKI